MITMTDDSMALLQARLGTMGLHIPKLRTGTCYPSFLEPRKASEQALGMAGMFKSQISTLCAELDTRVRKFRGGS
jgi:putative transposase